MRVDYRAYPLYCEGVIFSEGVYVKQTEQCMSEKACLKTNE